MLIKCMQPGLNHFDLASSQVSVIIIKGQWSNDTSTCMCIVIH